MDLKADIETIKDEAIEHKTEIFSVLGFIAALLLILKEYIMIYVPAEYAGVAALVFIAAAFISSKKDFKAWATMAVKYKAAIDAGQEVIATVCDAVGKEDLDNQLQESIDEFQELAAEVANIPETASVTEDST